MPRLFSMCNWLDAEIDFYDFLWTVPLDLCPRCVTNELIEDFRVGGEKFELMKSHILRKFPTREVAMKAFLERDVKGGK